MSLNRADAVFLEALAAQLPAGSLRRPVEARYLSEPRGLFAGQAAAVACPASTDEVSAILRHANEARVPVVPYGGGTGLVGGQVMAEGPCPLLLSLERMTKIRQLDPAGNAMIVEAGAILADVQQAAQDAERFFPLSLASEGSARIGGLLGTNAGGTQVLRWGNMRDLCLGVEVVLADGRVMNGLKRLRKNNMGYDLRNLMIGSEGTLGVITAAVLKLVPQPARTGAALIEVGSPTAALALLQLAQQRVGEGVSGFELISGMGLSFLRETMPDLRVPFEVDPEWAVLIDLGLPETRQPVEELEALFEAALDAGLVRDGLIAMSEAQRQAFWTLRESIPEANRKIGSISSHDISVPLSSLPAFIEDASAEVAKMGDLRINCFGHVGDGNLHFNVFPPKGKSKADFAGLREQVMDAVHGVVMAHDGSLSAEHGVGRLKAGELARFGDPVALDMMRAVKLALDPQGILNPGVVLR